MVRFTTQLQKFDQADLWHYFFEVPGSIADSLIEGNDRRVICSINDTPSFQCAIMLGRDVAFFINVNQGIRSKHQLKTGNTFSVSLEKDRSEYGLPFPDTFREVLLNDPDANRFFEALSPGKKRNLIYIVGKMKSPDKQIEKALVIAAHLKKSGGRLDFKQLNEDFKNFRSPGAL